jgi:hypothetical protein
MLLVDAISLKPERRAQLEEFARQHGKDAADALDEALAAMFAGERRDSEEAVEGIRRGYEDVRAGRHRSAKDFLQELRVKHDLPRCDFGRSRSNPRMAVLARRGEDRHSMFRELEQAIQEVLKALEAFEEEFETSVRSSRGNTR